jgi:hypothetical protein
MMMGREEDGSEAPVHVLVGMVVRLLSQGKDRR